MIRLEISYLSWHSTSVLRGTIARQGLIPQFECSKIFHTWGRPTPTGQKFFGDHKLSSCAKFARFPYRYSVSVGLPYVSQNYPTWYTPNLRAYTKISRLYIFWSATSTSGEIVVCQYDCLRYDYDWILRYDYESTIDLRYEFCCYMICYMFIEHRRFSCITHVILFSTQVKQVYIHGNIWLITHMNANIYAIVRLMHIIIQVIMMKVHMMKIMYDM